MKMFLYDSGDANLKQYGWIDAELNFVTSISTPDIALSGNVTSVVLSVDKTLPYMAIIDNGRFDQKNFATLKFENICSPDCSSAGCSAWPTQATSSCLGCPSGKVLDTVNNCVAAPLDPPITTNPAPISAVILGYAEQSTPILAFLHPSVISIVLPIQTTSLFLMLDIEYSETVVSYLSFFVKFSEDDILTNTLGPKIYDTKNSPEELKAKFTTSQFDFRSSYFLIQGLRIFMKIFALPFFILALFYFVKRRKSTQSPQETDHLDFQPENTQRIESVILEDQPSFFRKVVIKLGSSLILLTQFDGYTYLVSSARVKSRTLDVASMAVNTTISIAALAWFSFLSTRKSIKYDYQFQWIKSQFIHSKNQDFKNLIENSRTSMPVVIIHTIMFALKSLVHILSHLIPGSNVFAFCLTCSALALVQCKAFYKNPNYESEVVFYIASGILEMVGSFLVMAFKIWPKMGTEGVWAYSFLAVMTLYILVDILAFVFL